MIENEINIMEDFSSDQYVESAFGWDIYKHERPSDKLTDTYFTAHKNGEIISSSMIKDLKVAVKDEYIKMKRLESIEYKASKAKKNKNPKKLFTYY